jgi:hypothetical protein
VNALEVGATEVRALQIDPGDLDAAKIGVPQVGAR